MLTVSWMLLRAWVLVSKRVTMESNDMWPLTETHVMFPTIGAIARLKWAHTPAMKGARYTTECGSIYGVVWLCDSWCDGVCEYRMC